jgi:hypothetical protein
MLLDVEFSSSVVRRLFVTLHLYWLLHFDRGVQERIGMVMFGKMRAGIVDTCSNCDATALT